jgi:hypothetical protein
MRRVRKKKSANAKSTTTNNTSGVSTRTSIANNARHALLKLQLPKELWIMASDPPYTTTVVHSAPLGVDVAHLTVNLPTPATLDA